MNNKSFINKIIPFTVLPIAVHSIYQYASVPIGNTAFWWLVQAIILLVFFWGVRYFHISYKDKQTISLVKWYIIWNLFSIVRGPFVAESYWDYKGLTTMSLQLLVPIIAYLALDPARVRDILSFFIKYTLPFAGLIFPFLTIGAWGWYLFPICMLMLFLPILPIRGKAVVILVTIIAGFVDFGTRSHVIKYSMPIILLLTFYSTRHFFLSTTLLKAAQKTLVIMPLLFFVLAVTGVFEIFKMDQYIKGDYVEVRKSREGEIVEERLTVDTRTFLYVEVLQSAIKNNYWLIGRSPARGNETVHFAHLGEDTTGRPERLKNEVGILNVFTWTGVVGIVLFFLVFYRASFLAVYRSNNIFIKLVGLFVAFRWAYSWVEDYQGFDMNNFVLWLMIGMCFSSSFREMNNTEVKLWAWGIFDGKLNSRLKKYSEGELMNSIQ